MDLNLKRWKNDILHLSNISDDPQAASLDLKARLVERLGEVAVVEFSWSGGVAFSNVLDICGRVPIPPYLLAITYIHNHLPPRNFKKERNNIVVQITSFRSRILIVNVRFRCHNSVPPHKPRYTPDTYCRQKMGYDTSLIQSSC